MRLTDQQRSRADQHCDLVRIIAKKANPYVWARDPDLCMSQSGEGLALAALSFDPRLHPQGEEGFRTYAYGWMRLHMRRIGKYSRYRDRRQSGFGHEPLPDENELAFYSPDFSDSFDAEEWNRVKLDKVFAALGSEEFTPAQVAAVRGRLRDEQLSGNDRTRVVVAVSKLRSILCGGDRG